MLAPPPAKRQRHAFGSEKPGTPFTQTTPCSRASPGRERPRRGASRDQSTPAVVLRSDAQHPKRRKGRSPSPIRTDTRSPELRSARSNSPRRATRPASRHRSTSRRSRSPANPRAYPELGSGNTPSHRGGWGAYRSRLYFRGRGDAQGRGDYGGGGDYGGRDARGRGDRGRYQGRSFRGGTAGRGLDWAEKVEGYKPSTYEQRQRASSEREAQHVGPVTGPGIGRIGGLERRTRFYPGGVSEPPIVASHTEGPLLVTGMSP